MAYTSGRAVKSSAKRKPTTVAGATAEVRRLIKRLGGDGALFTVESRMTADPDTLAPLVRTVITFPETVDASDLACAVEARLSGVRKSTWTSVSITVIREA